MFAVLFDYREDAAGDYAVGFTEVAVDLLKSESDLLLEPFQLLGDCLLYTSPSPRDGLLSRMPSSA